MRENKFPQFILSLPIVIGGGKVEQNCIMDHALWFYKQFLILSLLPLSLFPLFILACTEVVKTTSGYQFKSFSFLSVLCELIWAVTFLPTNLYPGLSFLGHSSQLICPFLICVPLGFFHTYVWLGWEKWKGLAGISLIWLENLPYLIQSPDP